MLAEIVVLERRQWLNNDSDKFFTRLSKLSRLVGFFLRRMNLACDSSAERQTDSWRKRFWNAENQVRFELRSALNMRHKKNWHFDLLDEL